MNSSTPGPGAALLDPAIATDVATFGAAHLEVSDLDRSLAFWEGLIGLRLLDRSGATARLGAGTAELLVLHAVADRPAQRGHTGLYHVALHLPSEPEFARVLGRLLERRARIGPTDHTFSKAIYAYDPDGLGLELTLETPELMEVFEMSDAGIHVVDVHGRERTPSDPLDVAAVMATLTDGDLARPLPAGTRIGHVHLHVADLAATRRFYGDLGLTPEVYAPGLGAAHFSAGGPFKHRLATNTWQGTGATPPPAGTARLRHLELLYDRPERLASVLTRLGVGAAGDRTPVRDPAGIAVHLGARS
jgi:catechol 2,3-dioxygenase